MAREGREFENRISKALQKVSKAERGFFIKSPTPMKMVPINGKIVPIYANKALCDFIGIYNSRFILIESKNVSGVRFEFKRLKEHQEKQLASIKRHGGVAIILINLSATDEMVAITIEEYLLYKSQTDKKSINVEVIKEIGKILTTDELEDFIKGLTEELDKEKE